MLVLARKAHQSIMIGDGIQLTVLKVRRGSLRLSIEAGQDVLIEIPAGRSGGRASKFRPRRRPVAARAQQERRQRSQKVEPVGPADRAVGRT